MDIPESAKKPVLLIAVAVIVFWICFIAYQLFGGRKSSVRIYDRGGSDENVAVVAAREAFRIGGDQAKIVLLLRTQENQNGSHLERQAHAFVTGFQAGLHDETGKLRDSMKILATKYQSAEAMLQIDWPPVAFIQQIARDYPTCTVIVSFCNPPVVTPQDRGSYDPARLPRVISLSSGIGSPSQWQRELGTGLVDVLFSRRVTPGSQPGKTPREIVEMEYWIITPQNLNETIAKASGG